MSQANPSSTNPTSSTTPATPPVPAAPATGEGLTKLIAQRRANRDTARSLGFNPYGTRVDGLISLADARARYDEAADKEHQAQGKTPTPGFVDRRPSVTVSGRVMLSRDNGKLMWLNLRDHTGDLQAALSQKDLNEKAFSAAKTLDLGDVVVVTGRLMKTRTGEITVWAEDFQPGAKSIVPPPEKWSGLQDTELRYRQRYVDLWANPETMKVFQLRSKIVTRVREFLNGRAYLEVETPMMQALAGGAAARPFVTKMNALDINLFLRIAPELYLKRLLVGGLPRVYEINRNFRNEGLDKQHNPEFTMLEAYHAFGDVETVMELTESIIRDAASLVASETGAPLNALPFGELNIDYAAPFVRVTYGELFRKAMGFDMTDGDRARAKLLEGLTRSEAPANVIEQARMQIAQMDHWLVVNELFEEYAEGLVDPARPTFITDYPAAISPLTRPKPSDPTLADRADLFIAGMEIAPHYTELNDPDVQEAKFREQLRGMDAEKTAEENTFRTMDHDFLRALAVGMPPAGGMGLGIDRLVMLLTNQRTIRDVVLFPLMRPEA
ncbi:MAG: lysine--tRNA ligase [Planctomycetota bacterium]|nr:lysine--tRNA ligase [Planctomycetota bacterium]